MEGVKRRDTRPGRRETGMGWGGARVGKTWVVAVSIRGYRLIAILALVCVA